MVLTAGAFLLVRSEGLRIAVLVVLPLLSVPLLFSEVAMTFETVREQRQFSGAAHFKGAAFELAQAIVQQDAVSVKELIPAAGDLNAAHGEGTSLWPFGVLPADNRHWFAACLLIERGDE